MTRNPRSPLERALVSLRGLCLGDAFGARLFYGRKSAIEKMIQARALPMGRWRYTDDTAMAKEVVEELAARGAIDQDSLAARFAEEYRREPGRGYGSGARKVLERIGAGVHWREAAGNLFQEVGSLGNGAAMRVAPLGAFFADDPDRAAHQAALSAEVTHLHDDGITGAVAVAMATVRSATGEQDLLEDLGRWLRPGPTRDGLERAGSLLGADGQTVARELGAGQESRSATTVPLAIWCAQKFGSSFEEALWQAAAAATHDRDTVCAIVGGIVAARGDGLPEEWWTHLEGLPERLRRA